MHYLLIHKANHAYVGAGLVAAGFVPSFINLYNLQSVYFALLIPPALWHIVTWVKKTVIPEIKKWHS